MVHFYDYIILNLQHLHNNVVLLHVMLNLDLYMLVFVMIDNVIKYVMQHRMDIMALNIILLFLIYFCTF
jgi:hypothetical protein